MLLYLLMYDWGFAFLSKVPIVESTLSPVVNPLLLPQGQALSPHTLDWRRRTTPGPQSLRLKHLPSPVSPPCFPQVTATTLGDSWPQRAPCLLRKQPDSDRYHSESALKIQNSLKLYSEKQGRTTARTSRVSPSLLTEEGRGRVLMGKLENSLVPLPPELAQDHMNAL